MRSAKTFVAGLGTAALVFATVVPLASVSAAATGSTNPSFSDIAGNNHETAIEFLAQLGIVSGVGGGLYDPQGPVNREEMAKIVVNLVGDGQVAAALADETPSFTDAASISGWADGYVNVAADLGIINGFPDGSFQPLAPVTEVQAVAMLVRAIGDQGTVTGTWPGNYVTAAYNLGIVDGVSSFLAGVPASRGQVAQMAYEAAVTAPLYQEQTTNGVTTYASTGKSLYETKSVGGNMIVTGTATNITSSAVTIGGTSYNFAATYQIAGVSSLAALAGQTVLANVSGGNVNFIEPAPGVTTQVQSNTLATSSTAVPSGYLQVGGSTYPWLVTDSSACYNGGVTSSSCSGTFYLLLGSSSPSAVALATYTSPATPSSSATTFYVNPPASNPTDINAVVPGAENLTAGANVTYVLNGSGQITTVTEMSPTFNPGRVTSTTCASGCNDVPATGAPNTLTFNVGGTAQTVDVTSYTAITVNGAAASLSSALVGDVVNVYRVGNQMGSTGDINATSIAATQDQVTGQIDSITTDTSGTVQSFQLTVNGNTTTYTADSDFSVDGLGFNAGDTVTVALDSSGDARYVVSSNASAISQYNVALVNSVSVLDTTSGETYQLSINNSTATLPAALYSGGTYTAVTNTSVGSSTNGAILYAQATNGDAVAPGTLANCSGTTGTSACAAPVAMTLVSSTPWTIESASSNGVTLQESNGSYLFVNTGNAFAASTGAEIGFAALTNGDAAVVYMATYGGANYYAVVDTGSAPVS